MGDFGYTLAYTPEKVGARLVAQLDDNTADYDFDTLYVFQRLSDGAVFFEQDFGCSCPGTLDNVEKLEDLTLVTAANFEGVVVAVAKGRADKDRLFGQKNTGEEVAAFLKAVRDALGLQSFEGGER